MATLTKKSIAAIKKTGHNDRKKPFYEVAEGLPRCHALTLLGSVDTVTAETKKMRSRAASRTRKGACPRASPVA